MMIIGNIYICTYSIVNASLNICSSQLANAIQSKDGLQKLILIISLLISTRLDIYLFDIYVWQPYLFCLIV